VSSSSSESAAFGSLAAAERLLVQAETDPTVARQAAVAALRALLFEWSQQPRGERVLDLLLQAAETDASLEAFRPEAEVLDRFNPESDALERAKIFVDAARARLANI
jgi:HEPN domain-containing protein